MKAPVMLKLYFAPHTCSFAPFIALEEAGATFEPRRVNFAANEQNSPDYRKLNPKSRVPLLVTEHGAISENTAILPWIAQAFPAAMLAPLDDIFAFAQVNAFCGYLASTVHVNHAHRPRGIRWADDPDAVENMKEKVPKNMADNFTIIENEFFKGPWVMGENYTIADPYLYTVARWLEGDGVDPKSFAKVHDFMQRMADRPAVQRAHAVHNAT